jgi:hypothetical protein
VEQKPPRRGRPVSKRSIRLTDRDRSLLAYMAEHRFVVAAQIAVLLGVSETAADARLRALRDGRYLERDQPLAQEPALHRIKAAGLRAAASDLPTPRRPDLSAYRHDLGLGWLALAAERGRFGPLNDVISERRMRSHDGRVGDAGAADTPSAERPERFGVRLGGVGPNGRERLHYPDLLIETASGHRVAFELELSTKSPPHREQILSGYAADRRIDAVVYLVERPAVGRAIERSARRVGAQDLIRVQHVMIETGRPGGSGRASAAERACRQTQTEPERGLA